MYGQGQPKPGGPPPYYYPGYPPPQGGQGYPAQGGYPPQGGYPGYPPPGGYPGYPPGQAYPMVPPRRAPDAERGAEDDSNSESAEGIEFSSRSIQMGFIRKVYSVLAAQLALTIAIVCLFLFSEGMRETVRQNPWLMLLAVGLVLATGLALSCCTEFARKTPANYICLAIFTLAEGFMVGCLSLRYNRMEFLYAFGITLAVVVALTLFACQTAIDFTVLGGVLCVACMVLILFGVLVMFFPSRILALVYSCIGALLFSIYLIYDTQMIIGGKHKYSYSREDYVFAALSLYLDIILIFQHILHIIGFFNDG